MNVPAIHHPLLTSAFLLCVSGSIAAYLWRRRLDRVCPRVPIEQVSPASACRYLLESASIGSLGVLPWGTRQTVLLNPRADSGKSRWLSSLVALQTEVPISLIASYGTSGEDRTQDGADQLHKKLLTAFLAARSKRPEAWVLDRGVPPLSFLPGTHLFGDTASMAAYLLGTWSTATKDFVQASDLPATVASPVSDFPSNADLVQKTRTDVAGTVMYWSFPSGFVEQIDKAAALGCPWRLMIGGYQEWIVEKVSEETARVTYISVECSDLHPLGHPKRDFKKAPKLAYEAHVLYAQSLLHGAITELKKRSG